jgi:hypothetical protein
MKTGRLIRSVALSLAAVGMCLPQITFAVEPAPAVLDVALSDGGVLHGQVVNTQGAGAAGLPVYVRTQDRDVATATTAADGTFNVQGLKGGVYEVSTVQGHGVYRLWSPGTAPPVAQNGAVVYTQSGAVDSGVVHYTQNGGDGAVKMFLTNPIVIAGVVATAVALPVALNQWHHTPVSP